MKYIAFIHTSTVHIKRFTELLNALSERVKSEHFVNKEMLDIALQTGIPPVDMFLAEIDKIKKNNFDSIICTCSTFGTLCEKFGIQRIDAPVAEYMVKKYTNIAVVYTANSTFRPSALLLDTLAKKHGKTINIIPVNCSQFWSFFESGDMKGYYSNIVKKIKEIDVKPEAIFLAQASMEGVKGYLGDTKAEVLTSPEIGIRKLVG
ncbi:hypothetical protein FUAX_49890 (plasmid) [Fulvitalea axinellae]|uniref:Asp/Glu/Hydantoin racemase n=1 Tax=Fulvitalea axinellae TaxID=1182444 RepID=A0AAU9D054_9BACT|nr:hypothetical protein FUAX_49890 [Fulvitalea axinellae]